jgi:hypothetical protein
MPKINKKREKPLKINTTFDEVLSIIATSHKPKKKGK